MKITPYYVARGNLLLQEIHSIWFKAKRIFLRLVAPSISIHQCNNKVGPANSCLVFVLTDHGPNIIDCQPFDTKTYIATFFCNVNCDAYWRKKRRRSSNNFYEKTSPQDSRWYTFCARLILQKKNTRMEMLYL